ncbi:MAG: hypothetical protein WC337_02870 [Candidatus Muiribacteriota bacterium]
MAIRIKAVPVLEKDAAIRFNSKARASVAQKSCVNFSKQVAIAERILAKAKI